MRVLIQMIDTLTNTVNPFDYRWDTVSEASKGGFIPHDFEQYHRLNRSFLDFPRDITPKLLAGEVAQVEFIPETKDKHGIIFRKSVSIRFTPLES